MRYSDKYKVCYIAYPKCASTSMVCHLDSYIEDSDFFFWHKKLSNTILNIHGEYNYHLNINQVIDVLKVHNVNFSEIFSYTIIRNPWDLCTSAFRHFEMDKNGYTKFDNDYDVNSAGKYSFEKFLENYHLKFSLLDYAFDSSGNQLVTKIYKLEEFSIKQLETDINNFINTNIDFSRDYRFNDDIKENATLKDKNFREYYTSQWMIDKVEKLFQTDIKIGNYKF